MRTIEQIKRDIDEQQERVLEAQHHEQQEEKEHAPGAYELLESASTTALQKEQLAELEGKLKDAQAVSLFDQHEALAREIAGLEKEHSEIARWEDFTDTERLEKLENNLGGKRRELEALRAQMRRQTSL